MRLSYKNEGNQNPIITDSNDYYPFGMSFVRNSEEDAHFATGSYKNYKYQEQELQETGFYSFKWRQYMPDIGRFFNIDPLATSYPYNSPYAFQENKMGLGRELEGLELVRDYRHAPSSSVIVTTKPVTKLTHWTNASLYFAGVANMPRNTDVVTTQSKTSFIYKNDRGQTVGSKSDASYLTVHQDETKFINDQSSLTIMSEVSTAIKQTSQIFEDYTIKNGELKQVDSDSTPIVSATPVNLSDTPKGHQTTVTKANNENTNSSNNQMIDIAKQKSTDANNNHWESMEIPKKELERVPEAVKNPW